MLMTHQITKIKSKLISPKVIRHFYDWRTRSDTIYAPATEINTSKGSPLCIIRISGTRTEHVIRQITPLIPSGYPATSQDVNHVNHRTLEPRRATLTKIHASNPKELVDVGLILWFPKPNSYTGEDVCELHLHGSKAILSRIMDILSKFEGLRPAEPGEFTRRAVDNKKLSLLQAESLPELIRSRSDQQRKLALQGLVGKTYEKYDKWINELVIVLGHLEASIDFGEDELLGEHRVVNQCIGKLDGLFNEVEQYLNVTSHVRDIIQSGARVCILGRPNSGKSTFMNLLCRQDRSIVSDLSGTTRDVVEHSFDIGGNYVTLSDTAGLRTLSNSISRPHDNNKEVTNLLERHEAIEREGIKRALDVACESDIILYVIDGGQLKTLRGLESAVRESLEIISTLNKHKQRTNQTIHFVINKIDLWSSQDDQEESGGTNSLNVQVEKLRASLREHSPFEDESLEFSCLSCKTNENFDILIQKISKNLSRMATTNNSDATENQSLDYVNERHLSLLRSSLRHLNRARKLDIRKIDEMAQHVRESVDYLSRIVGNVTNDEIIDVIFRDFCIGK